MTAVLALPQATTIATAALARPAAAPGVVVAGGDAAPLPRGKAGAAVRLRAQFPARSVPESWPGTELDRDRLLGLLVPPPFGSGNPATARRRQAGIGGVLHWLAAQPGGNWQQRWIASGVEDSPGSHWREVAAAWLREAGDGTNAKDLSTGLLALLCGDAIRPGVKWTMTRQSLGEIEGLQISLAAADSKLTDLDRLTTRRTTVHLGMPTLDRLAGRTITGSQPPDLR